MAQQIIDIGGAPNDGNGETLREGGDKINDNFTELYADKAPLASPALTGTPTAPTAAPGTNTTQIATTAFVAAAGGGYTDEQARDALGTALTAGSGITKTVDDAGDTITLSLASIPYVSGNWYPANLGTGLTLASGAAMSSTITRLVPFTVRRSVTITDLGARVTTVSAGGLFRVGIYAADGTTLKPTGNPLGSVGGLSTASLAAVSGAMAGAVTLQPGTLYWAAIQVDNGTAAFQTNAATSVMAAIAVGDATLGTASGATSTGLTGYSVNAGYASGLPDMTGQTFTTVQTAQNALLWWKAQ